MSTGKNSSNSPRRRRWICLGEPGRVSQQSLVWKCRPGRKTVVQNGASRVFANWVDRVSAADGTNRKLMILEISLDLGLRRRVGRLLLIFQRPHLFGTFDHPQIVDARVPLRRVARFDEVWDGDGRQHADKDDAGKPDNAENDQHDGPRRQAGFFGRRSWYHWWWRFIHITRRLGALADFESTQAISTVKLVRNSFRQMNSSRPPPHAVQRHGEK